MRFEFKIIEQESDFEIAKSLFLEYARSLNFDLCFQNFEKELQDINIQYSKPSGGLILLVDKNTTQAVGCVGVRRFEEGIGELKRMYIQNEYRGNGLGKQLLHHALALAKALGYQKMRLDTVSTMKPAIAAYVSAGFYEIESYRYNPLDDIKYFEIVITE